MNQQQPTNPFAELVDLSMIQQALDDPTNEGARDRARKHLHRIIRHRIGALVEYQEEDGSWQNGVVVAYMVAEPRIICGKGNDRNKTGDGPLLACPKQFVRPRGGSK